jgi:hypothetical protein
MIDQLGLFGRSDAGPSLYVTNAASRRLPFRGPGRVLTIMARPRVRYGEAGDASVPLLVPQGVEEDLMQVVVEARRAGSALPDVEAEYRKVYMERLVGVVDHLQPGVLRASDGVVVECGDTLICACSRAVAAEGRCHRCWAATALARAGWRPVLDGSELRSV